jgi:hypothetical protein
MKFLSFNAREVGGSLKQLALKWLVLSHSPAVILIQEIVVDGARARSVFEPWMKSCSFYIVDIEGHSRGLIIGWSPSFNAFSVSALNSTIFVHMEDKSASIDMDLRFNAF